MVAIDNKFEGSYVVRRGGYWYFFGSAANCCAGPDDRLQRPGRALQGPAWPLRRPRGRAAAAVARRRSPDAGAEREPVDRRRPQRRRHRPGWAGLDRLPRARPRRPVAGRAAAGGPGRDHRAADADRPARLGRRLAVRPGRCRTERRHPARSGHQRPGVHDLRGRHPAAVPHRGRLVDRDRGPAVAALRRRRAQPLDDHRAGGRPGPGAGRGRHPRRRRASSSGRVSNGPRPRCGSTRRANQLRVQVLGGRGAGRSLRAARRFRRTTSRTSGTHWRSRSGAISCTRS